jgi:hypothetical protein
MNRDRLEELLWERVDGTISDHDLAELEAHLAERPEPRQVEREILRMSELLDSPDNVPPPAELRSRIDQALSDSPGPALQARRPPAFPIPTSARRLPYWMPIAASLLLGVAIGALLQLGPIGEIDDHQASGSMTTPEPVGKSEVQVFDLGDDVGRISARREGSLLVFDFVLVTEVEVELVLEDGSGAPTVLTTTGPGTRRLVSEGEAPGRVTARIDGSEVATHAITWDHDQDSP